MSQDPSVAVCEAVAALVDDEFSVEGWETQHDRFGRSKGMGDPHDQAIIGVYPEREFPRPARVIQLQVPVVLQFHLGYDAEPDENIVRDPRIVAAFAGRLRRAFAGQNSDVGDGVWFLQLGDIEYPPDPTGNITRFEARIEGTGSNAAALP